MAVETQYYVVKVNELAQIKVAQGADEIIINDVDTSPLETKKITAKDFAISIKDYILPIATDTILGGVKIGDGLTINPITGVLSNDIKSLTDLDDVIILEPKAGEVIRYNGVQWINQEEGGFTNIIAGDGLYGGGTEGEVILHVNAGAGLSIQQDQVTVNAGNGLEIIGDMLDVAITSPMVFVSNRLSIVTGTGLNISGGAINFVPSLGLIPQGPGIRVDNGNGLIFEGNKLVAPPGNNLVQDNRGFIAALDMSYDDKGVTKFAPLLDRIEDFRGTSSYHKDAVNPALLDKLSFVPTGSVFYFAGRKVPEGFLFCDGSKLNKTLYRFLYDVIEDTYNDGTENDDEFRLPDLRNEFVRGATTTADAGPEGERIVGSKQGYQTELLPHTHYIPEGSSSSEEVQVSGSASVTTPGAFPTSQTSGFVWGFTMNRCNTPHRFVPETNSYVEDETGNFYFNHTEDRWEEGTLYEDPQGRMVNIPPGCAAVSFPVDLNLSVNGGDLQISWPTETHETKIEQEVRPRNIALLPCIKY